ncbi:MAG: hypothetical protein ACM3UU_02615 [Ignavibacteriales bacterium]
MKMIDAEGIHYSQLNTMIKEALTAGAKDIHLKNVEGQRYIGDGLTGSQRIVIEGTPGNDMAAYMNGIEIIVKGNAQDAAANTMNEGLIVIHGNAGDTLGYAIRGGEVFVKGNVGYRVGIHMKEYKEKIPVLIIGGKAGDFLGEYMAGGRIILLGLNLSDSEEALGNFCGTGMHGGEIFIRGGMDSSKLGKEVRLSETDEDDLNFLSSYVERFAEYFGFSYDYIMKKGFVKLTPYDKRPYGNLYAY